jgi:cellulose synthase/poly-beta-1,6-N-acetylglucosamine synthase-like glycosyltransferase
MMAAWSNEILGAAWIISLIVITSGIAQTLIYFLQLVVAAYAFLRRPVVDRSALLWHRYVDVVPPVAMVVPVYNEELNAVESVKSILSLEYPNIEVIVVNDGSKDQTLARLVEAFELTRFERPYQEELVHMPIRGLYSSRITNRLFIVDKENGGKADAMNAGINVSRAPIFCAIDGDSLLEPDALLRAVEPFVEDPDRTIAVGGTIRVANGSRIEAGRVTSVHLPKRFLPLFQVVEYLRSFLLARLAWSRIQSLLLISGAFGVFRRAEVVAVGGFTPGSMGEDLDLILKLHRHMMNAGKQYRIEFIPEPVCWTEVPETLKVLGRQRSRWQVGALEAFFRYKAMLFNPRYGRVGFLGFGQMLLVDVLGPIMEVLGYVLMPLFWLLGILALDYLLAFTALVFTYGVCISVCSLILEELELRRFPNARDLAVLAAAAILENFGYRQINNFWRIRGWWQFLLGRRVWGEMPRSGLSTQSSG